MRPRRDVFELVSRGVTLASFAACVLVLFTAPLMALTWRLLPFPGFLVDSTLTVNARTGEGWSGRAAGLDAPQEVTRLGGEPVANVRDFSRALQGHTAGDTVSVFTRHPDGRVHLYPTVRLGTFSLRDLLALFWLPYGIGLAYFIIGVWVYLARGRDRPGRALAAFCISVSVVAALLFDVLTTHFGTAIWLVALAMLGGTLVTLTMRFPIEWGPVHRRPWLLGMPYLISLALAAWGIVSLSRPDDPWMYLAARSASYRYAALACLMFFAVMIYRAPRSRDAAVRRQARLVLVGSVIAFTPAVVWFLAPVFGVPLQFNTVAILPALLLFPITVAVAITRYRLIELDALVNRAIVYGTLTAILAGLYTAAIGLSQRVFVDLTGEESDAAVVVTTLIVVSAITPLRNLLQTWVDRQFLEVPAGALRSFGSEVQEFLEFNDPDLLSRRLLGEAVTSLGAESGAVIRVQNGRATTVHTQGPWSGTALMSVPLENDGESFGVLMIGPRRNGRRYRRTEAEALTPVARAVARAMRLSNVNQIPPES
ncbi:MAG TPA: hypothetical protein VLD63_05565 [Anaerolineales bacterium]|nr:hypothetical protein [Anaerolineales bacterium]